MMIGTLLLVSLLGAGAHAQEGDERRNPMNTEECKRSTPLQEIRFLEKFVDDLKSNVKRATTRRGIRCVKAGMRLKATDPDGKHLGTLMVSKAILLRYHEINKEIAKAENTTIEGLKRGLVSIYGPEIKKQNLTAIFFLWLPSFGQ